MLINGFIEDVYDKLGHYDTIIFSGVLHEVPNPNEVLQAIYKICNENTILRVNVSNVYSLHNLIGYEMGIIENLFKLNETDIRFKRHNKFDKKFLIEILKQNGFEIIEFGSYFIKPFTNQQMEQMLSKKIISEKVIEGLDKVIKYIPEFGAEIYANVKKR